MFDIMGKPANLSLSRNAALNNVFCAYLILLRIR